VFVTVSVVDENGTLIPDASDLITFKAEGAGVLAAVDSADINSHESYQGTTRKAFQGLCFAMLKANSDQGKIKLIATAPNLKSASISINVTRSK
jgi:beta-galactosidase